VLNVSESNVSLIEEQREVVQPRKVGVCLRFGCVLVFLLKKKKKTKNQKSKNKNPKKPKALISGFESLSCALWAGDCEKAGIPLNA
jgi:hypothetical protein